MCYSIHFKSRKKKQRYVLLCFQEFMHEFVRLSCALAFVCLYRKPISLELLYEVFIARRRTFWEYLFCMNFDEISECYINNKNHISQVSSTNSNIWVTELTISFCFWYKSQNCYFTPSSIAHFLFSLLYEWKQQWLYADIDKDIEKCYISCVACNVKFLCVMLFICSYCAR